MPNDSVINPYNHRAKKESTTSLMLKYMRKELPKETHIKVANAIEKCESCRKLYQELSFIFDETENTLYEAQNEEEIARTDALFSEISDYYQPMYPIDDTRTTRSGQTLEAQIELAELDDCISCGS